MTFRPILPYGGSDGWKYLRDTLDAQRAKHDTELPTLTKIELETVRLQIGGADSVEKLVDDPLFRRVALQAFGLGKTQPTRAFLIRTLTTPTTGPDAARGFADARWFELARSFGYGDGTPKVADTGFADALVARHRIQAFDEAVGAASPEMRRALAFDRQMASIAAGGFEETQGWERALADPAIRPVLEQAFGLGAAFDAAPRAEQVRRLRTAAEALTGSRKVDAFADADRRDALLGQFFDASRRAAIGSGSATPRIGPGGVTGWRVLAASRETQQAGFARSIARDPDFAYFAKTVATKATAADFVADKRLVGVALRAFGLGQAQPRAEFLQRVLESDAASAGSYASQLGDPRWRELAAAFGYGDGAGARVGEFGFADEIADRLALHGFEEAVGKQDGDMRLALILDRTVSTLAGAGLGTDEGWRAALANPSVALALGRGFDLGEGFAALGIDQQLASVKAAAKGLTGSEGIDGFGRSVPREVLLRRFLDNTPDSEPARGIGQPVLPLGGVAGWTYLKKTLVSQQESFADSITVRREVEHFRARIGTITSAEELVADRRVLAVALEAFGMAEEIDKRAFLTKALTEGTENPRALAARMVDPRYREFVAAFGFGDGRGAQTRVDGFAEGIIARYKVRAFETAVGQSDETLRLALNFDRSMKAYGESAMNERTAWFRIIGDVPVRKVIEGAFNLPGEFSKLDVDRQVAILRGRAGRVLGESSVKAFADPANREALIRRFLVTAELGDLTRSNASRASALTMLQQMPRLGLNRLA